MEEHRQAVKQDAQEREDFLIERIHEAILLIRDQKKPLTLQNIADCVGKKVNSLRKYPRIDALFQQQLPGELGNRFDLPENSK